MFQFGENDTRSDTSYHEEALAYLCPQLNNDTDWETSPSHDALGNMTMEICSTKNLSALFEYYVVSFQISILLRLESVCKLHIICIALYNWPATADAFIAMQ